MLVPTAAISTIALLVYTLTAAIWMPNVITGNLKQFGFFGISLGLVTWFSGASICLVVGACAGPVLAEDHGPIGRLIRGPDERLIVDDAPPSLDPPDRTLRLRDAFTPETEE